MSPKATPYPHPLSATPADEDTLVKVPEPLLETKMVGAYTSLHKSDRSSADYMGGSLTADLEQMLVSM